MHIIQSQIFTLLEEFHLYLGQEVLMLCSKEIIIFPITNASHLTWEQVSGDHVGMVTEDNINLYLFIDLKLGTFIFKAHVTEDPEIYDYITVKTRPTDYPIDISLLDNSMKWEKLNNINIKYILKQYDEKGFFIKPPYYLKVLFSDTGWRPSNFTNYEFRIMRYETETNNFFEEDIIQPFIDYFISFEVDPTYIDTENSYFLFGKYIISDKIYYTRGPELNLRNTYQVDTYNNLNFFESYYLESKRAQFFTSYSEYLDKYKLVPYKQSIEFYSSNRIEYKTSSYKYIDNYKLVPYKQSIEFYSSNRSIFDSIVIG